MTSDKIQEIKEIIQSSNINFLFGAGVSSPFLPLLGSIETEINQAIKDNDEDKQVTAYKKYLQEVMLPNKDIIDNTVSSGKQSDFNKVNVAYKSFFQTLTDIVLNRKTTILDKQVNIFTTNIDVFLETVLEESQIEYNDGFSGRLKPIFNLGNLKKSIFQRSLHFGHRSEIPIFNIFKIHGSLTRKYDEINTDNILLSKNLSHITDLETKTGANFITEYKKNILVVNPENSKFSETVLNMYYYELLRSYSSELERENSVLFVLGFSMADQHIRKITLRLAKSNPTLKIFIFVYSKGSKSSMDELLETSIHKNIEVLEPEDDEPTSKYTLEVITNNIFKELNTKNTENGD